MVTPALFGYHITPIHWQPEHVVGQAPASTSTQIGAASPGALQQIFHGGQHASPQQR